jgi:hypothetical protein
MSLAGIEIASMYVHHRVAWRRALAYSWLYVGLATVLLAKALYILITRSVSFYSLPCEESRISMHMNES